MIPLSAPLDDLDFDALVEIARQKLPLLAEEWTDYNYSDPGITLVELLAWIADTQIYSIGRDRVDERREMAGLLGIRAEGAKPAAGTVFAREAVTGPQLVAAGTRLIATGAGAPRLEVAQDVMLWPLEIAAIQVETAAGTVDHTASNAQPRATYAPFGEPPSDRSVLRVVLQGDLGSGAVELALGFELEDDDEAEDSRALGDIAVTYAAPDGSRSPVARRLDTTGSLRRSGVMILALAAAGEAGAKHGLEFRSSRDALIPRLLRITPNALPVVQRATFRLDPFTGTGLPGQTLAIETLGLFAPDETAEARIWRLARQGGGLALDLRVEEGAELRQWRPGDFRDAGPDDPWYSLSERPDGSLIEIGFGNGVNGLRPPARAQILVELTVSAGRNGDIAAGNEWRLDAPRTRWENRERIGGGKDADDLADMLRRLRKGLRSDRTLATSRQIEEAARALPRAYGVVRASVIEGWEPGRRRPASAATRTLIVTRAGDGNETPDWLRAIGRELRPRIALAERLRIEGPAWRRLRVRVRAIARPGRVAEAVAAEIRAELADRLRPSGRKGASWPLGQDVTAMAVGGWIRRLAGVSALAELVLLGERGQPIEGEALKLGRGELPLLVDPGDDVRVEPGARP